MEEGQLQFLRDLSWPETAILSALIIKKNWLDLILDGSKTWQIRGNATIKRGRIALIESRSGTVVDVAELAGVIGPLSRAEFARNHRKAGLLQPPTSLPYKRTFAWVLRNAVRLKKPVAYKHPAGAVIWVTLPPFVEREMGLELRLEA